MTTREDSMSASASWLTTLPIPLMAHQRRRVSPLQKKEISGLTARRAGNEASAVIAASKFPPRRISRIRRLMARCVSASVTISLI